MAHYAFLNEENIVIGVIKGIDEDNTEDLPEGFTSWEEWYGNFKGMTCKRTSYNTVNDVHLNDGTPFRRNYAGIGYTYLEDEDIFIPPAPFPSWTMDSEYNYQPPIDYPNDYEDSSNNYYWDEDLYQNDTNNPKTLGWVLL